MVGRNSLAEFPAGDNLFHLVQKLFLADDLFVFSEAASG